MKTIESAVRETDMVIITNSSEPVIRREWIAEDIYQRRGVHPAAGDRLPDGRFKVVRG
jgi:ornithine cyclodeaminase/alanine dehydrogenase-like protein (mu-crystallin family)